MSSIEWAPKDVPLERPSAARIYDWMLGGYHHFEVDRQVGEKMVSIFPDARLGAIANRAFLRRSVEYLIDQGIEQILDIGSGIPTVGNVHEVAQSRDPEARVVYVDIDPVAISHSYAILQDNPRATAIQADISQPQTILGHPEVQALLDFSRPLGLLFVTVLHYIVDDGEAYGIVKTFREAVVSGSYLVIAHGVSGYDPPGKAEMARVFGAASKTKDRIPEEIERFFAGFELVEPGLVSTPLWRPEGPDDIFLNQPERSLSVVGVGCRV